MLDNISRFFREVHPHLKPGADVYPQVFATDLFFPLQRQRELAAMVRIARMANPCPLCKGLQYVERKAEEGGWMRVLCSECKGGGGGPVTVMEIGADKGGGLYHWCMCLPTVRNVIACEIRGTPYRNEFRKAFTNMSFMFCPMGSQQACGDVQFVLERDMQTPIDVLFIDGDKNLMLKDFEAYLPLMRRPGGVVFIHDITDDVPYYQWRQIVSKGFKTEVIVDKSEYFEKPLDWEPKTTWEGWLKDWKGRSCGVGVVYL